MSASCLKLSLFIYVLALSFSLTEYGEKIAFQNAVKFSLQCTYYHQNRITADSDKKYQQKNGDAQNMHHQSNRPLILG